MRWPAHSRLFHGVCSVIKNDFPSPSGVRTTRFMAHAIGARRDAQTSFCAMITSRWLSSAALEIFSYAVKALIE